MVNTVQAQKFAIEKFRYKGGAFYGSPKELSLGVGLIYRNVRYPLYEAPSGLYDTVEGTAYILTHECDVDQKNERAFNEYVLLCPIIPFSDFIEEYSESNSEDALFSIISDLVSDRIYRVFYLPHGPGDELEAGGLVYLNQICSTHVSQFRNLNAKPVCALSDYAQSIFDNKLQNHLLRPKDETLPRLT